MPKVITVGCSSPVTKVFNFDACRITDSIVDHSCATSGNSGSAPTFVKNCPNDISYLNPGILPLSPSSFSLESADAMIHPRVVSS